MTKEEAMTRFMAAKEKKRQCVERLEEKMKQTYEKRTGKPANYTFVL
jgi:vacuolar-type H+-ATPase subunit H